MGGWAEQARPPVSACFLLWSTHGQHGLDGCWTVVVHQASSSKTTDERPVDLFHVVLGMFPWKRDVSLIEMAVANAHSAGQTNAENEIPFPFCHKAHFERNRRNRTTNTN